MSSPREHPYISPTRFRGLSLSSQYRYLRRLLVTDSVSQINKPYLRSLLEMYVGAGGTSPVLSDAAKRLEACLSAESDGDDPVRTITVFLERLADEAGVSRFSLDSGFDSDAERSAAKSSPEGALPVVLYLPHIRSPFNLGNIIRTAAAFGLTGVVIGRDCPSLSHPRLLRTAMGALDLIPVTVGEFENARSLAAPPGGGEFVSEGVPMVVLETGGVDVYETPFPQRGVLVVGHEELGVPEGVVRAGGPATSVVTIPHRGPKNSLNVGVAAGIALALWDRQYRRGLQE